MNRYLLFALLIVDPLIVMAVATLAIYGLGGPLDDAKTNAIAQWVGVAYGLYAIVAFLSWRRSGGVLRR